MRDLVSAALGSLLAPVAPSSIQATTRHWTTACSIAQGPLQPGGDADLAVDVLDVVIRGFGEMYGRSAIWSVVRPLAASRSTSTLP